MEDIIMITEIEKLYRCLQDAQMIMDMATEKDLFKYFKNSKTDISKVFQQSPEDVLNRWESDESRIEKIREYLLMEYIALNISDIYKDYDFLREMTKQQMDSK